MDQQRRVAALKRVPILATLARPDLEHVVKACRWQDYDAGEEILSYRAPSAEVFFLAAGKVRVIGASNFSAARLASALEVARSKGLPRYAMLQPEYNLYSRAEFERELQPLCQREGIGVIPFYGLASGFLSGKYRKPDDAGKSPRGPGVVEKYLNPRGLRIVAAQDEVAARVGANNAQVAIAWLMAQPTVTAPIVSATDRAQVDDLAAAARLQLDDEALAALDRASAP